MSTLVVSNISDGTTTVGASYVTNGSAKAWVNFNGTGTAVIRDSMNVSSLTDNTVGDYTISYTNNFANATYSGGGFGSVANDGTGWGHLIVRDTNAIPTASAIRLGHIGYANWADCQYGLPVLFGDLA